MSDHVARNEPATLEAQVDQMKHVWIERSDNVPREVARIDADFRDLAPPGDGFEHQFPICVEPPVYGQCWKRRGNLEMFENCFAPPVAKADVR